MRRPRPISIAPLVLSLPVMAADLVVDGTSLLINTDTQVAGNVIVRNGGVLTVTGCTLTLVLSYDEQYEVDVLDSSRLDVQGATITSTGGQYAIELQGAGASNPRLDVSGSSLITNHAGIRPHDGSVVVVTGGDVEELQVRDQVSVAVQNAACYFPMFFNGQTATLSGLTTQNPITTTIDVPGGWSASFTNADVYGYQIDLLNGANVTVNNSDGIVLSIRTPGNLGATEQVVEGVTGATPKTGSVTNLGSQFFYQSTIIEMMNVYTYGTDRVLLRDLHVNEVNASGDSHLAIGQVGYSTLLDCNLCQVYDSARMVFVAAQIDASTATPSATASSADTEPVGAGVMDFTGMDLTQLYLTARDHGTINLCGSTYDPAKVSVLDTTATFNAVALNADFTGAPRIGPAPLSVLFTEAPCGTVTARSWSFGDGGTSTAQNPAHVYAAAGSYDVAFTISGPGGSDTETKAGYVLVTQGSVSDIVTGPGPDPAAPPRVLAFDVLGRQNAATDITAYSVLKYGANVGVGELDGTAPAEILTGPGPGSVFGPQVRAFTPASQPLSKVNYYAYGTLRFGVNVAGIAVDADAFDEILTGAGPGAVFGPHVRGWNVDGGAPTAMTGVSFYAYGTLKYGVNIGRGNVAGLQTQELLTMPGPGGSFGPVVRGFRFPPLAAIAKINFSAFATGLYGGRIAASDLDGDGWDEILAGRGPQPSLPAEISGFEFDDSSITSMVGVAFVALPSLYGAEPQGGELDGDGSGEILASAGPDPSGAARARGFDYAGTVTPISALDITPYGTKYGLHTSTGALGF